MKQCPKCSRTYANDKQKFCTKDGTALVDAQQSKPNDETVRIDSAQLDDEVTKYISSNLPAAASEAFDPYKTTVSTPEPIPPSVPEPSAPAPPPAAAPPAAAPSSSEPAAAPPEPPAATGAAFDPFKTTMATSDESPAVQPDLSKTVASPAAVPPAPKPPAPAPPPAPEPSSPQPSESNVSLPTMASLPSLASVTTGNIGKAQGTNASISADTTPPLTAGSSATPSPAAVMPPPAAPAKKRSKLPLILGILFVLLLVGAGGAVAGYFFLLKPMLAKKLPIVIEPRPEPTPTVTSTPDIVSTKPETPKVEVPPYSPPADAVQFVNSSDKLDGKLAEHFVDFSFYYPKTWQKDPKAGVSGASNFAKVERRLPPDFTQENFAVGWYSSSGSEDGDRALFPTLTQNLSAQFAKSFGSDYKKISEGPTKAGVYGGYEFRFESASRNTEHGDLKIWGRVIFLPPADGGSNGVTLLMLTTSLAPELKSVDDVGVKGDLPMLLASFRFGK